MRLFCRRNAKIIAIVAAAASTSLLASQDYRRSNQKRTFERVIDGNLKRDPLTTLNVITKCLKGVENSEALTEALVIKLTNSLEIPWDGRRITHRLPGDDTPERRSIDVRPFASWFAGATGIIFSEDSEGALSLAVVKNRRRPGAWRLPEGFSTAGPVLGGEHGDGPYSIAQQTRAESLIKKGLDGYRIVGEEDDIDFSLGQENWQSEPFDVNLEMTIRRELEEEIGLDGDFSLFPLEHVSFYNRDRRFPHIKTYFSSVLSGPVRLNPKDTDEIEIAAWLPVSDIALAEKVKGECVYIPSSTLERMPISPDHIQYVRVAVRWARDLQLRKAMTTVNSDGDKIVLFENVGQVESYLSLIYPEEKAQCKHKYASEFGREAELRQKKLLLMAGIIQESLLHLRRLPTKQELDLAVEDNEPVCVVAPTISPPC